MKSLVEIEWEEYKKKQDWYHMQIVACIVGIAITTSAIVYFTILLTMGG